ncbi:MAG: class I SAM-dependent methyltransferase [Phycisphaeraceae bacterium]
MAKQTSRRNTKKDTRARNGQSRAAAADKYHLYQQTVQEADHEVAFFDRVYRAMFKRSPRVLREDFCGTFAVCCEWAKKRGRIAVGVDNDAEPLEWGRKHNLSKLPEAGQERVELRQQDVRKVDKGPKADVLSAQNFSFWCFQSRRELLAYFKAAHANCAGESVMVLDMMGGPECIEAERVDERRLRTYTYLWEQARFDPVTSTGTWHIHFHFNDGSKLDRAFTYDWRFWTIPEVRELLDEAGFDETHVYWEGADENGDGDGNWRRVRTGTNDPAWIAYIVAVRRKR